MTKRLVLMRHAKSDWAFELEDFDRPLNKRGRRSAEALGNWIREKTYQPEQVLCSSAARTRETHSLLSLEAETTFMREMYLAESATLLSILRQAKADRILMIAHNPGIAYFAAQMVQTPPDHARFFDYPTGATTVIDFEIDDWEDVSHGSGTAVDFVVPRDLSGSD